MEKLRMLEDALGRLTGRVKALEERPAEVSEAYLQERLEALRLRFERALLDYYLKSETYSREKIDELLTILPRMKVRVVDVLPSAPSDTTIYLLADGDDYVQYLYSDGEWRSIGRYDIDLSGYVTREELEGLATQDGLDSVSAGVISELQDIRSHFALYCLKSEHYSNEEIDALVSRLPKMTMRFVEALPLEDISETTIYLLRQEEDEDVFYEEYFHDADGWHRIGRTKISMEGYATREYVEALVERVSQLEAKVQERLVSGVTIKTINGESILGAGNIKVEGGSGGNDGEGGSCDGLKHVVLTQEEYDALEEKDSMTVYLIVKKTSWGLGDALPIVLE